MFVAGFVLAALPDASLIGFLGADAGYVQEAFRQMVQLVLAGFENDALFDAFRNTSRVAPGLFALVPTLTALYLARAQLGRLRELRPRLPARGRRRRRVPVRAADDHPRAPDRRHQRRRSARRSATGCCGRSSARSRARCSPRRPPSRPRRSPRAAVRSARAALTALKPLGLALLVTTVLGTALWIVNVATDGDTRGSRSLPIALVDTALYAVDHGVHTFELGTLAAFERRALQPEVLALPLPAEDPQEIIGVSSETFRLFAYRDGTGAVVFLLMLVVLIGIPLTAALYAGFLVAREREATAPLLGAAWGALVGPVWAIVLALLNGLLQDTLFGHAQGESVFGIVLVFGALIGAAGGFLAARADRYAVRSRLTPNPTSPPSARPSTIAIPSSPEPPSSPPPSEPRRPAGLDRRGGLRRLGGRRLGDHLARHLEVDQRVELVGLAVAPEVVRGERDVVGPRLGVDAVAGRRRPPPPTALRPRRAATRCGRSRRTPRSARRRTCPSGAAGCTARA